MFAMQKYHSSERVIIFYILVLPSIMLPIVVFTDATYQPNEHVKYVTLLIFHNT